MTELKACEKGGSPNNGHAYVPGKAGPGPQVAQNDQDQLAGLGPPSGNLNDQLFPGGCGPAPTGSPPIEPVITPPPTNQRPTVTICPINSCGAG